jgi:ATP-dependent Clp protease ATP-binding subunit ClpA
MTTNLTALYSNNENPNIIGRDEETELLFLTLLRHEKPNVLLVGDPGVGKTSIVHHAAFLIANDLAPKKLKGFQIIEVNTNALLAGPGYRGVTEEKFQNLIDTSMRSGKVILFMDEFHTVEHLGEMANGQTPGLGNTLKPYLTRPDFRVIGATTSEEASRIKDKALLRRFFKITVKEPTDEALLFIIRSCLHKYGKGLSAGETIIPQILQLSKSIDGYNPDKVKDITDLVCSYCKLKGIGTITTKVVSDLFDKMFIPKEKSLEPEFALDA